MDCLLCHRGALLEVTQFRRLPRVTSDCRPWPKGGRTGYCDSCGAVQKLVDDAYRAELQSIYGSYVMYAQSGGAEQRAFDPVKGSLKPRSVEIVRSFAGEHDLPVRGSWLDVGCGNGATLRAVSARLPGWRLIGSELDERNANQVEAIAGVERLHVGELSELDDAFDVISLVHVLEHLEAPSEVIGSLRRLLRPGGLILIESPLAAGNAFDLAIVDHVTHFDEVSLQGCLERAGMRCRQVGRRFFDRELYAVAALEGVGSLETLGVAERQRGKALERWVNWLLEVAGSIEQVEGSSVGIFGSSIGATFAYAVRSGDVAFFLDEDPDRIGRTHLGIDIISPDKTPAEASVFVPLPPQLAGRVVQKAGRDGWLVPPQYPDGEVAV
jgi:SAM-dependent methyltransferase